MKKNIHQLAKIKGLLKDVESKQYCIVKTNSDVGLYTTNLGSDIAYTLYSKELGKVAMARQLSPDQLKGFYNEYIPDPKTIKEPIKMSIFGGDKDFSSENVEQLLDLFKQNWDLSATKIIIECVNVGVNSYWDSVILEPWTGYLWDGKNVPEYVLAGVTELVEYVE